MGNCNWAPTFLEADNFVITPLIHSENYIDFLINYCKINYIDVILPLFDVDLPVLASSIDRFNEHSINVIVSHKDVINICNDKWKSFKFFSKVKISTPKSYISLEEVTKALKTKKINFPLFLKPRFGCGSIGVIEAHNMKELKVFYKYVEFKIFKSYIKYDSYEHSKNCVIIQEKVDGEEFGMDVLNDLNTNYVSTFIKKKIEMKNGETYHAITFKDLKAEKIAELLSKNLKHILVLDVDYIKAKNGNLYVIDINCRFGGGYPFSHIAGADVPSALLHWLQKKNPPNDILKIKYGVESVKGLEIKKV